jgi:hypothetical protein
MGALSVLLPLSAAAVAPILLPPPGNSAWKALEFPKIPKHTEYRVEDIEGSPAFMARADCSASAMYVPAESIDLDKTPVLHWRWKVEEGIDVGDERARAGDDFAARVYVMFRFDPRQASLWERAQHALGTALYGDLVPGNAINYVWASRAAVGSSWKSPYTGASQMIVKRSGVADGWAEEAADLRADYAAAFGQAPPPLLALAVMSDADNTCQKSKAYFMEFQFSATEGRK